MKRRDEQLQVKNNMGLAHCPDELIDGMAEFLMKVGIDNSYLDERIEKMAGIKLWTLIYRGLLNPYSHECKFFHENMRIIKENEWQEEKRRRDEKKSKRMRRN